MALHRKKDDGAPSKKKDTDVTSAKGGRGGSFGTPQSAASSGGYTYTKPAAVEETYENFDTMKALAKAQRGLYAYEEDSKKNFHTSNFFQSFAPADAPQIVHDFHAAVNSYARDDSHTRINSQWNPAQKLKFGYLYDSSPREAKEYAITVNNALSLAKTHEHRQRIRESASQNPAFGVLHTAGALGASTLFSVPELLDRAAQIAGRRTTVEKPYLTPMDYSAEVQTGIRDKLNGVDEAGVAHRAIDPSVPVLGGKGWGDLYSIGFGVAESWLSGNTVGRAYESAGKLASTAAILGNAFARTAVTTMDSARRSGADGTKAAAIGITQGLIEAGAEMLPVSRLLKIKPSTTVKEFLDVLLRQSAMEGLTETLAEGLGQAAEYKILGDSSTYSRRRASYLQRGFSQEEASRKALGDSIQDLGFVMVSSTAAGAASAGAQSVLESSRQAIREAQNRIRDNGYDITELFNLRHLLMRESGYNERFMRQDMKPRNPTEERYAQLLTRVRNTQKAMEERKFHEDAIRKEISKNDDPEPLSPELYRMAAEMAAPYGWGKDNIGDIWENERNTRINTPGETGEKAIPYSERGIEIEARLRSYISTLSEEGKYIVDQGNRYSLQDLQILTAETGVEYSLITVDGKSYMIRGNDKGTTIPEEVLNDMHNMQGELVCHSHPFIGDLNPSKSDLDFIKRLTWQSDSIIIDPTGEMVIFDKHGVVEKCTLETHKDDDYYQKMFGGME